MRRTQIYLDEDQKSALRVIAADRGTNVSDVVRDAVDRMLRGEFQNGERAERFDALRERVLEKLGGGLSDEEMDAAFLKGRSGDGGRVRSVKA